MNQPSLTLAAELQRKHEEALLNLAAEFDRGEIDIDVISRATQALHESVGGLVDPAALTEMSTFLKEADQELRTDRRVFLSDTLAKLHVLSLSGDKVRWVTVTLGLKYESKETPLKPVLTRDEAVKQFNYACNRLAGMCQEIK